MTTELNRVTTALLVAFGVVAITAGFWAVVRGTNLRDREDNLRNVMAEQRIRRGAIIDRDGEYLAYSEVLDSGDVRRVYPDPAVAGAVGYYSFEYGTAGIEAAFDADLRGEGRRDDWYAWWDETLHRPQQGRDVRATIDLDVQRAAAAALGDHGGAVVVVDVPSGAVRAMVSRPGYDPNTLDTEWETLKADEATSPLLNRVTAGLYQPGGALQTVLLAAILATYPDLDESAGYALNTELPGARDPVTVMARRDDGVTALMLTCLEDTPDRALSLAEAYAFGCPAPFAAAFDTVPPEQLWDRFQALGLLEAPTLAGFETLEGRPPDPLSAAMPPDVLAAEGVGQGALTVTPLQMVQVVAAIANQGNAVPLHLVDAIREPGASEWTPVEMPARRPALLRADVAAAVRLTMAQAAAQSPHTHRAQRGDLTLYGHSALAFGGQGATPYAWFVGFVDLEGAGESGPAAVAVVVVVEDVADPGLAAEIAGTVFAAASGAE